MLVVIPLFGDMLIDNSPFVAARINAVIASTAIIPTNVGVIAGEVY